MGHPAKEYMKKLRQAYRRLQLVPFVGAGLSFPLGMPRWGTIIDDVCGEFDYELLTEQREEVSKLIREYRYLDAVDKMINAGILEGDLKSFICGAIQQKKNIDIAELPDNIYKDLAKMNCTKYLTTNYDNYLSDYIGKGPSDITHLYKEFINELGDPIYDSAVYNLHGDYTKPSTIVLSRESYDSLYQGNIEFKKVLEHFRESYVLFFIGVSLDDEYIQQVLEVGSKKLRARHYILLANISSEQKNQMEKRYDIRILKYSAGNGDHTTGIREILNEIMNVSDEIDEQETHKQALRGSAQGVIHQSQSMVGVRTESRPLMNNMPSLPSQDSKIYDKVKGIKKLQKNGQISEAIAEYNRILQGSISDPLSNKDKKLVIKGMLCCYILIRDYSSAAPLVEAAVKLSKQKDDADLLSYIVDYYFNLGDFELGYKMAKEWYETAPKDPRLFALKVYTETIYTEMPYEKALSMLLTEDMEMLVDTEDNNQRQYIYRLTGEIALYYKRYEDTVLLLRKAYEIDDNIFNIEYLGIATYFKAIEKADDGSIIKINAIDLNELSKAVEYFETGFARAKGSARQRIHSRVAIPYLRSLFYLRKIMEFDQMYDQLVTYCGDDLYEIRRMKAINDIQLNKGNSGDINTLNEIDKALILSEFYNMRGMTEHAIEALKPIVDKSYKDNEDVITQFLGILLNAKGKEQFNEYFMKYAEYWSDSERMPVIQAYYHEVNKEYEEAEKMLQNFIDQAPAAINYSILMSFYRRTEQLDRIGDVYATILDNKEELVNRDPDNFYLTYHTYLMQTDNLERAYWLYSTKVKSLVSSEVLKLIELDIKMRLSDFSGIIETALDTYEKYRGYGETIYAYYASVAYLYYNDFEKSRHYLNLYKANGYVDQRTNFLVKKVEYKLNVLQRRTVVDGEGKGNHIKDIAFKTMSRTREIRIPKNESIVIDAPALYVLFHLGEKQWLEGSPEVFITFTTIEQLHNVYCYCGDELVFEIIKHLRKAENVRITSPSLESRLNNRKIYPGTLQDFYDSLKLAVENGKSFVTAYHLPLEFQNKLPVTLPEGFKTIKVVNNEILIYTGSVIGDGYF